jgi:hypothetical protein
VSDDIKFFSGVNYGATTFSMMTVSIRTLSNKGLFVTLSINDTQYINTDITLNVVMLSVAFYLLLC